MEVDADTVVFDDELIPAQQRNLEKLLGRTAIDRTEVILDIFAQNARTQEGRAQVELAQLRHRLPRLRGRGTVALASRRGGIGARATGSRRDAARGRPPAPAAPHVASSRPSSRSSARPVARSARPGRRAGSARCRSSATPTPASRRCSTAHRRRRARRGPPVRHPRPPRPPPRPARRRGRAAVRHRRLRPQAAPPAGRGVPVHARGGGRVRPARPRGRRRRRPTPRRRSTPCATVLDEIGAGDVPELLVFNKIDVADRRQAPRRARHPGSVGHLGAHRRGHRRACSTSLGDRLRALDRGGRAAACPTTAATCWPPSTARARCSSEAHEDGGTRLRARLDDVAAGPLPRVRRRRRPMTRRPASSPPDLSLRPAGAARRPTAEALRGRLRRPLGRHALRPAAARGRSRPWPPPAPSGATRRRSASLRCARRPPAGWPAASASTSARRQVAACIGTKELVAGLPHCLQLRTPGAGHGPVPGRQLPDLRDGGDPRRRAGPCPCRSTTQWRLDLRPIDPADADRALCLWSNTPGNPAGGLDDLGGGGRVGPRARRARALRRVLRRVHLGRAAPHDPRARARGRPRRPLALQAVEPRRGAGRLLRRRPGAGRVPPRGAQARRLHGARPGAARRRRRPRRRRPRRGPARAATAGGWSGCREILARLGVEADAARRRVLPVGAGARRRRLGASPSGWPPRAAPWSARASSTAPRARRTCASRWCSPTRRSSWWPAASASGRRRRSAAGLGPGSGAGRRRRSRSRPPASRRRRHRGARRRRSPDRPARASTSTGVPKSRATRSWSAPVPSPVGLVDGHHHPADEVVVVHPHVERARSSGPRSSEPVADRPVGGVVGGQALEVDGDLQVRGGHAGDVLGADHPRLARPPPAHRSADVGSPWSRAARLLGQRPEPARSSASRRHPRGGRAEEAGEGGRAGGGRRCRRRTPAPASPPMVGPSSASRSVEMRPRGVGQVEHALAAQLDGADRPPRPGLRPVDRRSATRMVLAAARSPGRAAARSTSATGAVRAPVPDEASPSSPSSLQPAAVQHDDQQGGGEAGTRVAWPQDAGSAAAASGAAVPGSRARRAAGMGQD